MKNKLKKFKYHLFSIKQWLLLAKVQIAIVTYPKTGSTWLQLLIRKIFIDHFQLDDKIITQVFVNSLFAKKALPEALPGTYITHAMPWFNEESYDAMTLENHHFNRQKIILLIREPKDTLVSLYFHNKFRTVPPTYTDNINRMVYDKVYGVHKYIRFYQAWHRDKENVKDLLLVKYEDLRANPKKCLEKICRYVGLINVSEEVIDKAIAFCHFDAMKEAEAQNSNLPGLNRSKNPHHEAFKVRKGIIGGYKEHLSEEAIHYVDKCISDELPSFYNYP